MSYKEIKNVLIQIDRLKSKLHNSDYQAIKYAEGELTEEEFAPIREQRKAWRAEINALEAEIESLRDSKGEINAD